MYGKETSTATCLQILTDVSVVSVCHRDKLHWPYDSHLCKRLEYLVALKHWILRVLLLLLWETRDLTSLSVRGALQAVNGRHALTYTQFHA